MKNYFIYKKWTLVVLLNKLVISGIFAFKKKLLFLSFDTNSILFYFYTKKNKILGTKVLRLKKKFVFK
jgi:hypothetical protein